MGLIARLLGRKADDHAAVRPLWAEAVRIARTPDWYARGGIADTIPGRFDALSLVMALILLRMERSDALRAEPARLTELFVTEMDGTLRQQGVGDLVVGKRVGKLMSALGGRIEAYRGRPAGSQHRGMRGARPAVRYRRDPFLHGLRRNGKGWRRHQRQRPLLRAAGAKLRGIGRRP